MYLLLDTFAFLQKVSNNKKWRDIYNELTNSIPKYVEKSCQYEVANEIHPGDRSKLDDTYILSFSLEDIIKFPNIIYEALFNKEFKNVYDKIKQYIKK